MNLQFVEQRKEAMRARLYAAIADLVAVIELGSAKHQNGDVADDSFVAMRVAASRLTLDLDSQTPKSELRSWTNLMWHLQKEARIEHLRASEDLPIFDSEGAAKSRLESACNSRTQALIEWPSAPQERKAFLLNGLTNNRRHFTGEPEAMRSKLLS